MTSYRSAFDHDHYEAPEEIPLGVLQPSSNRLNSKTAESFYKSKPVLNSAPINQPSLTTTRWDGSTVMTTAQKSPVTNGVDTMSPSLSYVDLEQDPGPTSICMVKPSDLRETSVHKTIMDQYRNQIRMDREAEEQEYSTIRSVSFHPIEDLRIYEPLTGEHSENTFFPSPGSGSKVPRKKQETESGVHESLFSKPYFEKGSHLEMPSHMDRGYFPESSHLSNSLFLSKVYLSPGPIESYSPVNMLEYGGSIHLGDSGWGPYGNKTNYTIKSTASMPRYMKDTISCRNKKRSKYDGQGGTEKGTRKRDKDTTKEMGKKVKRDLLDFFRR